MDKILKCSVCGARFETGVELIAHKHNKIQLTEEQFDELYNTCILNVRSKIEIYRQFKQAGYIKKDIVEEAEEMYNKYTKNLSMVDDEYNKVIEKQHEVIRLLLNEGMK